MLGADALCVSWMLHFGHEQSMCAATSEEGVYMNIVQRMWQRRERLALVLTGVGVGAVLPTQVGTLG